MFASLIFKYEKVTPFLKPLYICYKNNVKSILLILSCLVSLNLFSQVILDTSLSLKYQLAFDKLPSQVKIITAETEKQQNSFKGFPVIMMQYKLDTLNRNDIKEQQQSSIVIYDTYDPGNNARPGIPDSAGSVPFFVCLAELESGVLELGLNFIFSEISICHKISKGQVVSTFRESYKTERILKIQLNDELTNNLTVPVTVKFSLSDTLFTMGKIIYGSAEIITAPYYIFEDVHYIKVSRKFSYYLKFKIMAVKTKGSS